MYVALDTLEKIVKIFNVKGVYFYKNGWLSFLRKQIKVKNSISKILIKNYLKLKTSGCIFK